MSTLEDEKTFGHVVTDDPSPPPFTSAPTSFHAGLAPSTADSQILVTLDEMRREQDQDRVERATAMSRLLALQQQLERRIQAFDTRPTEAQSVAMGGIPIPASLGVTPTAVAGTVTGINPALLATPATVRLREPAYSPGNSAITAAT